MCMYVHEIRLLFISFAGKAFEGFSTGLLKVDIDLKYSKNVAMKYSSQF